MTLKRAKITAVIAAFASMIWGFRELLFTHAPDVFTCPLEDLSYGWYVPVFSLYVIWTERRKLTESLGEGSIVGYLAMLPFILLGFMGVRGSQIRFEIIAFAGIIPTLAWAVFGRETAKRLFFPSLFLLFCVPLHSFLDVVTIHLRLLSTSVAYSTLHGFGIEVVRNGTMIAGANGSFAIDVADPCSGMRSLFAMLALTAGYGYFNQPTWLRRAVLFAAAVPIAVFGNVVRIFTIVLVAAVCSPDFATGFYHDYSGYLVFLVSISLMLATSGLITEGVKRCARR